MATPASTGNSSVATCRRATYFHWLHHRYFEGNYGENTIPLDRWFGTFRDGPPDGSGTAPLPTERHYQLAGEDPQQLRRESAPIG